MAKEKKLFEILDDNLEMKLFGDDQVVINEIRL